VPDCGGGGGVRGAYQYGVWASNFAYSVESDSLTLGGGRGMCYTADEAEGPCRGWRRPAMGALTLKAADLALGVAVAYLDWRGWFDVRNTGGEGDNGRCRPGETSEAGEALTGFFGGVV
jgi:hypothetical protein